MTTGGQTTITLPGGIRIQLTDWIDDRHYATIQLNSMPMGGAIPGDPVAAQFLFQAIAYAEHALGLPAGSAFPADALFPAGGVFPAAGRTMSTLRAYDAWLIATGIQETPALDRYLNSETGPILLRLQVTRTGGHLLAQPLSHDGRRAVGQEQRSRQGNFTAVDRVVHQLRLDYP